MCPSSTASEKVKHFTKIHDSNLPSVTVMCSGKLWGVSYCVTFTLEMHFKKLCWSIQAQRGDKDCRSPLYRQCDDIHRSQIYLTSGLNPLVKALMRLRVVPSSTPLQFKSTLSKAWVAQEFGISCISRKKKSTTTRIGYNNNKKMNEATASTLLN